MAAWRYQLDNPFRYWSDHLRGVEYANKWITIVDGEVTISAGYAWDGCSPAYYLPVVGWVGVPDGPIAEDGHPESYWASLVHDALCQFRAEIDIGKDDAVCVLRDLLLKGGFPHWLAMLYATGVRLLGPQDWKGRSQASVSPT